MEHHTDISAVWKLLVMSHTYLLSGSYWLCHTHICCLELTGYVTHISAVWAYWLCHTHIRCLEVTGYVTHISAVWKLLVILSIPELGNGGLFTYEVVSLCDPSIDYDDMILLLTLSWQSIHTYLLSAVWKLLVISHTYLLSGSYWSSYPSQS
jgi:hypothetical protein